jgi:outer membrane protein assembly factor BamE (lipoprotein component of BamABCDE complex)
MGGGMKHTTIYSNLVTSVLTAAVLLGCVAKESDLHSTKEREMTLGTVQKEIRVGMSQADVATSLGSPNIVTKDSAGKETWIYDKIATQASYSKGSYGMGLIIFGFGKDTGMSASTQKTLTVVVKYDDKSNVENVSYHSSKF